MTIDDRSNENSSSIRDQMRLELFMRQAAAIIAAERGLNAQSRLKLESLAEHQKLPARLFEEAIGRLQDSDYQPKKLNRYERAFAKYLAREFDKLSGGVLSTVMEQNAIELAGKKFQIPPHRADRIIAEQAELASISRISRSDAELYATQFIAERIGDRVELDDEFQNELCESGRKLGLTPDRVEREILRSLQINRSGRRSGASRWLTSACLILLIGSGVAISFWVLWTNFADGSADVAAHQNPAPGVDAAAVESPAPAWLSAATDQLLHEVASAESMNDLASQIRSEPDTRRAGYEHLVEAVCSNPLTHRKPAEDLICQLFFQEPDESLAFQMVDRACQFTRLPDAGFEATMNTFQSQIRANRLLALIYYYLLPVDGYENDVHARRQQLASRIGAVLGIQPQGRLFTEYILQSEQGLAVDQWNYVITNCWASPGRAAALVQPLYDETRPRLAPESLRKFRLRLLKSILELDPRQWQSLRRPIRESIFACDEVELMEWIDLVVNCSSTELIEFAGPLLAEKADLKSAASPLGDVKSLLTEYSGGYRNRMLQPLLTQNSRIQRRTEEFLESVRATDRQVTPDLIAQLALETNLNLALCQKIRKNEISSFGDFAKLESLLDQPKIRLRDLVALPGETLKVQPAVRPTAYELSRKNAAIEVLQDLTPELASKRILALEQLQKIAERFDDIPYQQSEILSAYLLGDWRDEEALNIQRRISAFANWPTLGLAIADRIEGGEVQLDQALTISRLYFGIEFNLEPGLKDWAKALQFQILQYVNQMLEIRSIATGGDDQTDWDRLELYLRELYRERHLLLFDDQESDSDLGDLDRDAPPFSILGQTLQQYLESPLGGLGVLARVQRGTTLLQAEKYNDLEKTILANQLVFEAWVDLAERENPSRTGEIQAVVDQVELRSGESSVLADQLLAVKIGQLELSSLTRKSMIEDLLKKK